MSGHFEFGPFRRLINFAEPETARKINGCWSEGRETEGWAHYWAMTYRYLARLLRERPELAQSCLLFRYEKLCEQSGDTIDRLLRHCGLDMPSFEPVKAEYCTKLSLPEYYTPDLSDADRSLIHSICDPVLESLREFMQAR